MRLSKYALSFIGIPLISGIFFLLNDNSEPVYQPQQNTLFEEATGQFDFQLEYDRLLNGVVDVNSVLKYRQSIREDMAQNEKADPRGLQWSSLGPTNVGGRTRAVLVDRNNTNIMWAGGVSGGMYISEDGGQTWTPKFGGTNNNIAAIDQLSNGYVYIGTGPRHDGGADGLSNGSNNSVGDGLYRVKSIHDDYEHIVVAEGSPPFWTGVFQIAAHPTDPDVLFVGTSTDGLQISRNASSASPTFSRAEDIIGSVIDVDVSADGNNVLACTNGRAWISNDGGQTFTTSIVLTGAARVEAAIAPSNGNIMYLSAVTSGNNCLHSILQSSDAGATWDTIALGDIAAGNMASFDPFANPGVNCQGGYDNAIAVFPDDPGRILVGGVQMWEGQQQPGSDPPLFGWTQPAITGGSPLSGAGFYIHADKHRILIPTPDLVVVGTDGGIGKSTDGGFIWTQNNKGFNITQFYSMAILPQSAGPDFVLGGTQDNGSLLVGLPLFVNDPNEAIQVQGGDGFDCDMSGLTGVVFTTSQFGRLQRTDQSQQATSIWDNELTAICGGGNCGPFYSTIEFWETANAEITPDSVLYFAMEDLNAGDTVLYTSNSGSYPLAAPLPIDLSTGDSVLLPDRVQGMLVLANMPTNNSTGIYFTRDAANLTVQVPEWSKIAGSESYPNALTEQTFTLQFSPDGNHLYVGTTQGNLFRISNLLFAVDSATADIRSDACVLTCTQIGSAQRAITGIAVDPNNGDNLIITSGGYSNNASVLRITDATQRTSSGVLTNIEGDLPDDLPVYDAEIDVSDNNIVLIGTQFGVWSTSNAFGSASGVEWAQEAQGMPTIPTYEVKQQTVETVFDPTTLSIVPAFNYKVYYIGTHGGGFYKTESLVGIAGIDPNDQEFKTDLLIYPNPVQPNSVIEFDLPRRSNASIQIYDIRGQLVREMNFTSMPSGKQRIEIETASLGTGTYIVNLQAGSYRDVTKFVKAN